MAGHTYQDQASRLVWLSGQFIGHAIPTEVLGNCGIQIDMPKNKTDTVNVASWVPFGATVANPNVYSLSVQAHILTEGMTPTADSITRRDTPIKLNQMGCLYRFTDKDFDMYEDDLVAGMKEQVGERMGLVRELSHMGQMKGSTNKSYAGVSAVSRSTVSGVIVPKVLQRMIRSLGVNHGKMLTKILDSSDKLGTRSVEAGYIMYTSTDAEQDIRNLPTFLPVSDYGVRKVINDNELGTWEKIRFITSPEFTAYPDAATGVTASTAALKSTSGTNPDVYSSVLMADKAFAQVKMRGKEAVSAVYIPTDTVSKADPLNQTGYIGAKFYVGSAIVNNGWLAVLEHGVSDLI